MRVFSNFHTFINQISLNYYIHFLTQFIKKKFSYTVKIKPINTDDGITLIISLKKQ